jgi:glycosyltransferase involved in cell wall biosynthesis
VRVALVHDWLITLGGADRVLLALHELFPQAPVHVSLYDPSRLPKEFHKLNVQPSWLQRVPRAAQHHRWLVPIMPLVFQTMPLDGARVIISSSHACAKGVRKPRGAVHICYCHTPMRYAWDVEPGYVNALPPAVRPAARAAMIWLRWWDRATSGGVDHFIANSKFVAGRIRRHYGREATVIYPPVDTEYFTPSGDPGGFYLVVSRLVPYKRVDLAVEAFNRLGRPLVIAGDGPEISRLRGEARPNVTFVGEISDAALRGYYRQCVALVFPGEEDFGIVPLEAQACGRPVIAFGRGGALESVVDGMTGAFFFEPTAEALIATVRAFDQASYDPAAIRAHAEQFSRQRFLQQMGAFVERVITDANAQTRKRAIPA